MKRYFVTVPITNLRTGREFTLKTVVEAMDQDHAEELGELAAIFHYDEWEHDIGLPAAQLI